jgi:acetolactate synthase-1/2/3 large subunit
MPVERAAEVRTRSGGELLVESLSAHGIRTVFGIPGTHNLEIFAAMPEHGIRNVSMRHEQGSGYAADGWARSTGDVAVVIATTGPGALNAATALAQSFSDSVPVLLVAPGMPTALQGLGTGMLHELRDQRLVFAGIVDHSHRVANASEIPAAVSRAFGRLSSGRRRAEYLEVPMDLLAARAEAPRPQPEPRPHRTAMPEALLGDAADRIGGAQRVVIIAGGGAAEASSEVTELAEMLQAPVVTTANGKGTVPEDHPLAAGAGLQLPVFDDLIASADAVIAVGTELASSDWWGRTVRMPPTLLRVDVDPVGVYANYRPSHPLVGTAAQMLRALIPRIDASRMHRSPWAHEHLRKIGAAQRRSAGPWLESLRALDGVLPPNAIVAADNAMVSYYGALTTLRLRHPRSFLFPTGFGTLGYALPAGIGAKLANPDSPVVVIQGDGGLMFTIAELASAAEARIALPVIVFDNGGYGEILNEMVDRADAVHSVALGAPDFVSIARAMGCEAEQLDADSELGEVVARALTADRPTLIHVLEQSAAATRMPVGG